MKHNTTFITLLLMYFSVVSYAQPVQDCGCSAALRYDIYRSHNDYYSEMLLARDISSENYRELQQQAGGNLSIFGISLGANGENMERIKQIYNERLRTSNVTATMSQYESITTSNMSYLTYQACMKQCARSHASGVDAYIIAEDDNFITIDVHYAAAQHSPALTVKYNYDNQNDSVTLQPNTWANPAVRIPRINRNGFTVVFSGGGQYESVPVTIKPYRPLTASLDVTYSVTRETPGSTITYSSYTRNNSDGDDCNLSEIVHSINNERDMNQYLTMADGSKRNDDVCSNEGFKASRIAFKATASNGYLLKNPRVTCSGGGCGGWVETAGYLRNDANMVVYTEKRYSSEVLINFYVDTYKMETKEERYGAISTNNAISLVFPPGTTTGVIRYVGGALPLGESNSFLRLIVKNVSPDGTQTYDYAIITAEQQTIQNAHLHQ